ncbi:MAG TPA: alpha/beta hydrolase [Pseudolabrys sp.]|nr:alpha/beta hydrolase [Pseudolabrys sp.]
MTVLEWLLAAAFALYAAVLVLMYVFQHKLMYFPDPNRTAPAAAGLPQAQELRLESIDGERLVAWHIPPRGDRPVMLYLHGNAGALNLRAKRFEWLVAEGDGLVALSYRGFGGSSGRPSEAGLVTDALAAYDFAVRHYPARRIVLWGESLGTAVAVALAAERDVGGVILDAPFTSTADVGAAAYPFAPVRWLIRDSFRADRLIGKVTAPLLVLHGGQDRVVPIHFGERLFALANEPKRMVRFPEGGHINLDDYGAVDVVREFVAGIAAAPAERI